MPSPLAAEIGVNFARFDKEWPKDLTAARDVLAGSEKTFKESYIRITSIQAWRTAVVLTKIDEGSTAFFFEAQNDFLVSHCMARCGSFRQALKALRSAMENIYFSMYYMDHRVELLKWEHGQHKIGFTELNTYFENHPLIQSHGIQKTGLASLKAEYATLSKAVHGSAKAFRMTQNLVDIKLWGNDAASAGMWAAREKAVILAVNQLLLHLFQSYLVGTKYLGLRETIGLIIPKTQHAYFKSNLKISIPTT